MIHTYICQVMSLVPAHDSYIYMSSNGIGVCSTFINICQIMTMVSANDSYIDRSNNDIGACSQFIHRSV